MGVTGIEARITQRLREIREHVPPQLPSAELQVFGAQVAVLQELVWEWAKAEVKPRGFTLKQLVTALVTLGATIHGYAAESRESAGEVGFMLMETAEAIFDERNAEEGA